MHQPTIGGLIRDWRRRRGLSQLALSLACGVSQRHISYVEGGKSRPSREMVLRLADHLTLALRDRNAMLLAAGFAPTHRAQAFDAPDMAEARAAVRLVLDKQMPFPSLALDRHWTVLATNPALDGLLSGLPPSALATPVNALKLTLRPDGLAGRILNFADWRAHVLARLMRDCAVAGDPDLEALLAEVRAYPIPPGVTSKPTGAGGLPLAVPFRLADPRGDLSFISTTTVFGSAVDVTLSEVMIETFVPADDHTWQVLKSQR